MIDLCLIGIGTGNPDHVTGEAAQAIRDADLILVPRKGADKADLADLRLQIIDRITNGARPRIACFDMPTRRAESGYLQGVNDWHDAIAALWDTNIRAADPTPQKVALLIWGDPSLYDSSLRIAARLSPAPRLRVVPGITALQCLTAAHAIPVNDLGAPFTVTTGRRLRNHGWPVDADTVAVMLDGECSFKSLQKPEDFTIWWGAYLGMREQILEAGRLDQVAARITAARAAARTEHGWIMDIYLLKKTAPSAPKGNNPVA